MRVARFVVFLTGMIGLAVGGLLSLTQFHTEHAENDVRISESLKNHAMSYVDQAFQMIDFAKNQPDPNFNRSIVAKAEVQIENGVVKKLIPNADAYWSSDLRNEERVEKAIQAQFAMGDFQFSKQSVGTFLMNEQSAKEGLFLITPSGNILERGVVTLLDPQKAMSSLLKTQFVDTDLKGLQAFLFSRNGRVIAHSSEASVGVDLKKNEQLLRVIEGQFLGAQTGTVVTYAGLSGPVRLAVLRVGILPLAVGVEAKAPPALFSSGWMKERLQSGAARRGLGLALVIFAFGVLTLSLVTHLSTRAIERNMKGSRNRIQDALMTPPLPSKNLEIAAQNLLSAHQQIEREQMVKVANEQAIRTDVTPPQPRMEVPRRNYRQELEGKIKNAMTLETVEKELCVLASEMTESPVLMFRYQRRGQNLILTCAEGSARIPNYAAMQIYVRRDIEAQVEDLANQGKVASVSQYGPLSKMMISQLNTAHFEAWAITSDSDLSLGSKMMGVFVVLQAGTKSVEARAELAQMLRVSGNQMYSIANRIFPTRSAEGTMGV